MQMVGVRNFSLNDVGSIFEAYVKRASSATWFELPVSSVVSSLASAQRPACRRCALHLYIP